MSKATKKKACKIFLTVLSESRGYTSPENEAERIMASRKSDEQSELDGWTLRLAAKVVNRLSSEGMLK